MKTSLRRSALALLGLLSLPFSSPPSRAAAPVVFETTALRLTVRPDTGAYEIHDKRADVIWRSHPFQPRFGEATVLVGGQAQSVSLNRCEVERTPNGVRLVFRPWPDQPQQALGIDIRVDRDPRTLEFRYAAPATLKLESVRMLDQALWVSDADAGAVLVPVREGLLVPADSGLAFTQHFETFNYEGCHMEMGGVVKQGAAALISWHDPYVGFELRSTLTNLPGGTASKQILAPSLILKKTARACRVQFLGKGGYVDIAKAYQDEARRKGWLVTWTDKLKGHPERARLFGASNYKLWSTLDRQMNEDSTREESSRVNWTFDEAAQVAEHLKRDLKMDKVLFILGGWIHRGYDNQHPDILPTAPECGGDAAFADCARRVRQLGYVFCLHDNYQDIYRDAPSWDEKYVMKQADGTLVKGGHWAGGRAYLTCSQMAVQLANRPQNLAAVQLLSRADVFFIDTTYAAGLQECFDPQHPLTRWDDMKWKQRISDDARRVFGMFASECGREWAIPHSDFFEGLTGVSGTFYHDAGLPAKLGATVVPLFELVYRDCIALYGKYGYDPARAAEYVLHHLALGRPLNYHNVPRHLYWTRNTNDPASPPAPPAGDPALFLRADQGWAQELHPFDRFVKNTHEILSPLNELTARLPMTDHQFLTPDRKVQESVFGTKHQAVRVTVNTGTADYELTSPLGGRVRLPQYGFLVEGPMFVAFHARNWAGHTYKTPTLFTLRTGDGKPLDRARQVQVYHAFGDPQVQVRPGTEPVSVERGATVAVNRGAR